MIGAVVGASITTKIGMKLTFSIGFIFLSMMVFCQILTAWRAQQNENGNQDGGHFFTSKRFVVPFLFISHIIAGFGQAIIWVAHGEYISLCATDETKGFFFALFWAFYMGSEIFGNLTGALIITRASGPVFFLIMGLIMLITVFGYIFLKQPKKIAANGVVHDYDEAGHERESFVQ